MQKSLVTLDKGEAEPKLGCCYDVFGMKGKYTIEELAHIDAADRAKMQLSDLGVNYSAFDSVMKEDFGSLEGEAEEGDDPSESKKIKIITVCRVHKFVMTKDKDRTRDLKILKWVAENERGHC
jgi:hypothetical protein